MPGRGRPWKGVGEGNPDRIGTGAIADGSITEADLDSSITTKLDSTGHEIQDEGTPLTQQSKMNFVGAGVVASVGGEDTTIVTIPSGADGVGYDEIQEEGTPLAKEPAINFVGAGVTATAGTGKTIVTIPGGGGHIIEEEGSPLASQPDLNFVGAGVTATNDSENTATVITIPGGSVDQENVADPFVNHYLYDEFYYPAITGLDLHYIKNGSFSIPNQKVSGQVSFTTPTTGNITHIRTCGGGLASIEADKKFRYVVRAEMTSNTLHAHLISLFVDGGQLPAGAYPFGTNPDPYIQFFVDAGNNWIARTDDGSTPNSTDTGVSADTAMHTFEIVSDPTVPNIVFKIDNNIVATFTTNLPTGLMTMYIGNQNGEASTKTMQVDSMFLFNER